MRSARSLVAILALALAASLGLAPTSSARVDLGGADARSAGQAVSHTAPARTSERAAATRITSKVVKRRLRPDGPRRLVLTGIVDPARGPVVVQKATRCNEETQTCNFKFYRKVFLDGARYTAVIDAPRRLRGWVWRAKVRKATSDAWVTCTKRPEQTCQVPY